MKKIFGCIIVLLISFFAVRSLLVSGYFPMHDDTQVARVVEMGKALRAGQFPVRWVSSLGYGYGYPIFNFYGPLPYYVGGALYALGVSALVATKLMMGIGVVAAGIVMFFVFAGETGVFGGILAAVLYMYAPYHAVQVYVRGAVGEYWALIFLPLIVWGFWKAYGQKQTLNAVLIGSVGVGGLILSHTIIGYVGTALTFLAYFGIVAASIVQRRDKRLTYIGLSILLLGLGLSAFFWLPAYVEMSFTSVAGQIGSSANFRDHFICLGQLWGSPWGYGGSASGCADGLSYAIGKLYLALAATVLIGLVLGWIKETRAKMMAMTGFAIAGISVLLLLPISQPIWEMLPLFSYVQYPWRFLVFVVFGISILGTGIVYLVRAPLVRLLLVTGIVVIVISLESRWFRPQYSFPVKSSTFESYSDIAYRVSKISDEYLPPGIVKPSRESDVMRDTIAKSDMYKYETTQNTDTYKKFGFIAKEESDITVRIADFPGWQYMVNGQVMKPTITHGLPVLHIPTGDSVVEMRFIDTPVRTIANIISLISVGIFIYLYDKKRK